MFEIGNTLREARLRRGWDLTRCETETKIRSKYLRAMEDEQFDVLPAPTYVRGFLRTYAEHLGLDWQLVLDEYESRFGAFSDPSWDGDRSGRARANARRGRQQKRSPEARLLWLALGGVLSVALLVWLGVGSPSDSEATVPAAPPPPPSGLTTQTAAAPLVVLLTGTGGGSDVVVRARAAGGRVVFAGRLDQGATKEYRVPRSLWIQVDDPTGVSVTVDGKAATVPAAGGYQVTRAGLKPQPAR